MKPGSTIDAFTCLLNTNIVALWRIPSAMSMTTSPQAGQKSPVTSRMIVDSPL